MSFAYDPADAVMVQPEGDYPAVISGYDEEPSKSTGFPMLTVIFTVYAPDGTQMEMKDYIVNPPKGSGKKSMIWKLKRIAQALGKEAEFEAGDFKIENYMGHNLTVFLKVKSQPGYDDQNVIQAYKAAGVSGPKAFVPPSDDPPPPTDDDLPF